MSTSLNRTFVFIKQNNVMQEVSKIEYKGYTAYLLAKEGSYCSKVFETRNNNPLEGLGFSVNTLEEAMPLFKSMVERYLQNKAFKRKNEEWLSQTDYESISDVLNIHPKSFKQRVLDGKFDTSLLESVQGGDYAIPLFYVTKAWDEILKGKLNELDFMICSEEDEGTMVDDEEMLSEKQATRRRSEAISQNDEMKLLWKELFNIDIDEIEIDFNQYNMHMPPNISSEDADLYFNDVPDGIVEWIPQRINYEDDNSVTFDSVSCLMEFTAYVIMVIRTQNYWNRN